jgi:hypothetical protein
LYQIYILVEGDNIMEKIVKISDLSRREPNVNEVDRLIRLFNKTIRSIELKEYNTIIIDCIGEFSSVDIDEGIRLLKEAGYKASINDGNYISICWSSAKDINSSLGIKDIPSAEDMVDKLAEIEKKKEEERLSKLDANKINSLLYIIMKKFDESNSGQITFSLRPYEYGLYEVDYVKTLLQNKGYKFMELPIRTNTDAIRWVIKYTEGNIIL